MCLATSWTGQRVRLRRHSGRLHVCDLLVAPSASKEGCGWRAQTRLFCHATWRRAQIKVGRRQGTAGLEGMQVVLTVWKKLCRSDAPRAERPPGPAVYGLSNMWRKIVTEPWSGRRNKGGVGARIGFRG